MLPKSLHFHLRVQHWVVWWFYVGIACGVIALANVFLRHLSETDVKLVLFFGVLFWALGGAICYAVEGVKIVIPQGAGEHSNQPGAPFEGEWHSASDFLLPGNRKSILPTAYFRSRMTRGVTHLPISGSPRRGK
jgi:hypothetical protein